MDKPLKPVILAFALCVLATVCLSACSDIITPSVKTSTASDIKVRWKEDNHTGLEYMSQEDYKRAIAVFKIALKDAESIGADSIEVAATHNNLAAAYENSGQDKKAIREYEDALSGFKKAVGPDFAGVATASANLADLYVKDGDPMQAASLYKQALYIQEFSKQPPHAEIAENMHKLGDVFYSQGKLVLAEPLYRNAVKYRVRAHGQKSPLVLKDLKAFSGVLYELGKIRESRAIEDLEARVAAEQKDSKTDDQSSHSKQASDSRR